jgi:hypothetical protein
MEREKEVLEIILQNFELEPRSYSGRYMFGKTCLGYVTTYNSYLEQVINLVNRLASDLMVSRACGSTDELYASARELNELVYRQLRNVDMDSMGRYDTIFYFRDLEFTDDRNESDEADNED